MTNIIEFDGVTKAFGKGRGIFDVSTNIEPGVVYGFIGTNGSGKTTTIRNLMGFLKPDRGTIKVKGRDAWKDAALLKHFMSYVPGQIEFPRFRTGMQFLKYFAKYLEITDFTYMEHLIEVLQLDPSANLRRMSKGMKQKTAIVAALMGDKEILVFDEPTTGLDPLMREAFLNLIRQEKAKGKTIFMSSHIFEEIEEVCDVAAIIHKGRVLRTVDIDTIRNPENKWFGITFNTSWDRADFVDRFRFDTVKIVGGRSCEVTVPMMDIVILLQHLKGYLLCEFQEKHTTLETYFKEAIREGE